VVAGNGVGHSGMFSAHWRWQGLGSAAAGFLKI
jgi:hypothetical protein